MRHSGNNYTNCHFVSSPEKERRLMIHREKGEQNYGKQQ